MKIKFYGVRGSTPVSESEYLKVGGNTPCIQVTLASGKIAILDSGTGIRKLGKDLIASGHEQFDNIFIGLSHTHWDHIQGFPFFKPAYDTRRHFTLTTIGNSSHTANLRRAFAIQMQKEFFPVTIDKMGASFSFKQGDKSAFYDGEVHVEVQKHNHPGGAFSIKLEENGKKFVYCTDIEHGDEIDKNIVKLSEDADLLIHDAQYTPEELESKKGWGHSSFEQACETASLAGANKLALFHHDPEHNDDFLFGLEKDAKTIFTNAFLAMEGVEIEI